MTESLPIPDLPVRPTPMRTSSEGVFMQPDQSVNAPPVPGQTPPPPPARRPSADPLEGLLEDASHYDKLAADLQARVDETLENVRIYRARAAAYRAMAERERERERRHRGEAAGARPDPSSTAGLPSLPGTVAPPPPGAELSNGAGSGTSP